MIARRPSFISFLSALTLCAVASQAAAATYDNLFVFGDSTVDSGWWAGALATSAQCSQVAAPCETSGQTRAVFYWQRRFDFECYCRRC